MKRGNSIGSHWKTEIGPDFKKFVLASSKIGRSVGNEPHREILNFVLTYVA